MPHLTPAQRVVVGADFTPKEEEGSAHIRGRVLELAESIAGTGVYLKVNSALRACGYGLISEICECGLDVFADLKLDDIGETMAADGKLLATTAVSIVTAKCTAGAVGLRRLKAELPNVEVLGVTCLTTLNDADANRLFGRHTAADAVVQFGREASLAQLDGVVCAATEVSLLRADLERPMTYNCAAIRPAWSIVSGDDQNPERIMTPAKAIQAGVTRVILGRPIIHAPNRRDAVMRTIDEIAAATQRTL